MVCPLPTAPNYPAHTIPTSHLIKFTSLFLAALQFQSPSLGTQSSLSLSVPTLNLCNSREVIENTGEIYSLFSVMWPSPSTAREVESSHYRENLVLPVSLQAGGCSRTPVGSTFRKYRIFQDFTPLNCQKH